MKRLSAVTNNRKQRVAAAVPSDMDMEDGSSKISRALTIVFLIHIVAIALIFVHQKFLEGRAPEEPKVAAAVVSTSTSKSVAAPAVEEVPAPAPRRIDLPRLAAGDKTYVVSRGDNYTRIASELGVDEGDLKLINHHTEIIPGLLLKVPPKRVVAVDPPEVTAIRNQAQPTADSGLVDAVPVDVSAAPRAQVIKPTAAKPAAPADVTGKSYVVQSGDSIWKIANRFKVNQNALMKANGITDAKKMKVGMNLVIPR